MRRLQEITYEAYKLSYNFTRILVSPGFIYKQAPTLTSKHSKTGTGN